MLPMLDSATKTTRPPRGQPARFKEERAARMDGPHAVHAGVAIALKDRRLFVTSRYDGTFKRLLMTACRTLPRDFGTGDQNVPTPLAYAAGGIGCLTDYFRPAALSTLRPAKIPGRLILAPLLALAPLICGFAPFGSPGSASFLLDVRPGASSTVTPFEASFDTRADFNAGKGSQFGADGAVAAMPFEFTNGGDVFYGQLSIDLDIRAIGEGRREVEVPSDYAMATLRRDSPTAPQTMLATGGWVRVLGMMVSPGGRSSAIRASFELAFSLPGPEGAPELVYRFSEAWFVSSPSPEELSVGQGGYSGDHGGGSTSVNVGVGINVVSDSGCGGDAPDPGAPAAVDSCAGDTTGDGVGAGADACSGDAADPAGGCDCAGDARASTIRTQKRVKAHPINRMVSRYLPFFAIWVFLQTAKAAVRYQKARDSRI